MPLSELDVDKLALAISAVATGIAWWGAHRGARLGREGVEAARSANELAVAANELAERAQAAVVESHDVTWEIAESAIDYVSLRNLGTSTACEVRLLVRSKGVDEIAYVEVGDVEPAALRSAKVSDFGCDAAEALELLNQTEEYAKNLEQGAVALDTRQFMNTLYSGAGKADEIPEEFELFDLDVFKAEVRREFEERVGMTPEAARSRLGEIQRQLRRLEIAVRWKSLNGREFEKTFEKYSFESGFTSRRNLEETVAERAAVAPR
ncbi:hypothetical protein [Demequina iriomotensis]|uniref:hypothetical protein n=1 Tax=Demequina iriomotensis TaxID=1536641 RepID=UPI000782F946|nr:hypothetical protein [Demequina iriomotensis]